MQERNTYLNFRKFPFPLDGSWPIYAPIPSHEEIIRKLGLAIAQRKGVLFLTGSAGVGKTMLLSQLRDVSKGVLIAKVSVKEDSPVQLLESILLALGVTGIRDERKSYGQLVEEFEDQVLQIASSDSHVGLILDDAHELSNRSLEVVRLLSNLMTETRRLLTIILAGHDSLRERAAKPILRQLGQRVALNLVLLPLGPRDIEDYVKSHFTVAGGPNELRFETEAYGLLHKYSGGIPRQLDRLCAVLVRLAESEQQRFITRAILKRGLKLCSSVSS